MSHNTIVIMNCHGNRLLNIRVQKINIVRDTLTTINVNAISNI